MPGSTKHDTSIKIIQSDAIRATVPRSGSKSAVLVKMLMSKRGVTIDEMIVATGWQAHSVRGFLAGTLRRRYGLKANVIEAKGGKRRYWVVYYHDG